MTPPLRSSLACLLAGATMLAALSLRADVPRTSLSPFQSLTAPSPVTTVPSPFELRGIKRDATGTKFRLYDPVRKLGSWVAINEHDLLLDVTAIQFYDPYADSWIGHDVQSRPESLEVDYQGRRFTLPLRVDKIASAVPLPSPVAPVRPTSMNASASPPAANTPRVHVSSLSTTAMEIERRRAERERAAKAQPAKSK